MNPNKENPMRKHKIGLRRLVPLAVMIVACGVAGTVAFARSAAAPQNTALPQISGTAKEGETLTASNGTWSNSPTSYAYQWRRCASDGTACGDISGATKQTYTVAAADVGRTLRVVVTASNADGKASATSEPSDVVDSKSGPVNTVKPAVSGTATVGQELSVSTGTWTPKPTSFGYQWQRCSSTGTDCLNVAGATSRVYGVRSADVDHRLRALVTARTTAGRSTVASSPSSVVLDNSTTTTSTTTVQGNKAPTITFISLRRVGARVFARFRVCDDGLGRITVIERDNKAKALASERRFRLTRTASCGTYSRSWIPAPRFRTKGRYVVTLRAVDTSNALSRIVSRSLVKR
jgi:Ig domain of plant-specific actin-binding protein